MLKNLTAGFVATLVPPALARAIVYGVALSCEGRLEGERSAGGQLEVACWMAAGWALS